MKNRHKKIVLEAEEGITFEVSNRNGEVVIRAFNSVEGEVYKNLPTVRAGEYAKELSVYTDKDGNQAVIPPGWTVSKVEKENTIWGKDVSLVIYRIPKDLTIHLRWASELEALKRTYSQFVWVPVKFLEANGTLDGENFTKKFGRRNYHDDDLSKYGFYETLTSELLEQVESVEKYGGFYISRYNISEDLEEKAHSVKCTIPLGNSTAEESDSIAATIENNDVVKTHSIFGAEYDSMLEWLIISGCKTLYEIAEDSTCWGNNGKLNHSVVLRTGEYEEYCANNIYDIAGNIMEWTRETIIVDGTRYRVCRGFGAIDEQDAMSAADRDYLYMADCYEDSGCRAALYIK